jgi:hypothetical protein
MKKKISKVETKKTKSNKAGNINKEKNAKSKQNKKAVE